MRSIRLKAIDDEIDTTPGWIIKGMPEIEGLYADREGGLLAHDLLEHQNGAHSIGPSWDELQALGGIWQVRGRHCDFLNGRRHFSPAETIAVDVSNVARDDQDWYFPVPRTHRHDYDEDFRETLDHARRSIAREFEDHGDQVFPLENFLDFALAHMRIGFRKATRRFGMDYDAHNLFRAVKSVIKNNLPDFIGQEAILRYGKGHAEVRYVN